ncbi:MAG TPA: ribosomal-protein-alanine N-acetyltransferase [Ignisphaera sp.]|nr:ribosomal-protein-alanine N-acetyltransferase [Ignisphaera sp.]
MIIREARDSDIDAVAELERMCFKDPYPRELLLMLRSLYPELFLVIEIDNKIVGYVSALVRTERIGHIVSICIHPDHRRRGLGTLLMKNVEERLKKIFGLCKIRLEVRVSNYAAINMYRKLGYTIATILYNYYPDGEDAYLMIKNVCED